MKNWKRYAIVAIAFFAIGLWFANWDAYQFWRTCRTDGSLSDHERLNNGCLVTIFPYNQYSVDSTHLVMASTAPILLNALPAWISLTGSPRREYTIQLVEKSGSPSTGPYWDAGLFDIVPGSNDQLLEDFLTGLTYNGLLDKNPQWVDRKALMVEARTRARALAAAIKGIDYHYYQIQNPDSYVSASTYDDMTRAVKGLPLPIALRK